MQGPGDNDFIVPFAHKFTAADIVSYSTVNSKAAKWINQCMSEEAVGDLCTLFGLDYRLLELFNAMPAHISSRRVLVEAIPAGQQTPAVLSNAGVADVSLMMLMMTRMTSKFGSPMHRWTSHGATWDTSQMI